LINLIHPLHGTPTTLQLGSSSQETSNGTKHYKKTTAEHLIQAHVSAKHHTAAAAAAGKQPQPHPGAQAFASSPPIRFQDCCALLLLLVLPPLHLLQTAPECCCKGGANSELCLQGPQPLLLLRACGLVLLQHTVKLLLADATSTQPCCNACSALARLCWVLMW
jgi:hypothetical protein